LGTSFKGQLVFAGDSTFVRMDNAAVDVWRLSGSAIGGGQTHALQPCPVVPNFDLLSTATAVLTCSEGSTIATVDLVSGAVETHAINSAEVKAGIAAYQSRTASNPAMGHPGVIPATGSDGAGSIYGMVLPAQPSCVPVVKFDEGGNGSLWKSVQVGSKVPVRKLLLFPGEIGLAFADGSVSWYPAT
jgi:hypothetical protein